MGMEAVKGFLVNTYRVDQRRKVLKKGEKVKPFEKKLNILAERVNQVGRFLLYPLSFVMTNGKNALELEYGGYKKEVYNKEKKTGIYANSLNDKIVATKGGKDWGKKTSHFIVVALMIVLVVVLILPEIIGIALKGISHANKQVKENYHWAKKHFEVKYYEIGSKENPIEEFSQKEISGLEVLHTRTKKGKKKYLRNNRFHQKINVIVNGKDLDLNENDKTGCGLNRLFYHESQNCYYNHEKIILVEGRFTGVTVGKKEGLIKELEKRNFLLRETNFSDGKASRLFQKQFKTIEEAKAYKAPINCRTLKRYNVVRIVTGSETNWNIVKPKGKKV
jgi:hypothetical protein